MTRNLTALCATPLLVCGLSLPAMAQESPAAADLAALVARYSGAEFDSFDAFLDAVQEQGVAGVAEARTAVEAGTHGPDQLKLLARMLGVYNRVVNEDDALQLLAELVAIESHQSADYPEQHENPAFIAMGEKIGATAAAFGLNLRNVDGRIFEVTLDGPSEDVFGILTHSDVVPVLSREWQTEGGATIDPFQMTVEGNRIYGRGTLDDKGSIATGLYAMKAIRDSGLPLGRDIRLMIETTEEIGGSAMEYYLEQQPAPDYNIVLDSRYPAVTAEKGPGTISARFPVVEAFGALVITGLTGSAAANQIPETAIAEISADDAAGVARQLNDAAPAFIAANGGDFSIGAEAGDGLVTLTVTGVSAHASQPETGVNPVPRLAAFLLQSGLEPADNHYLQAIRYIDGAYGLDYLAGGLGVGYADDFMGPLTVSPTYFNEADGVLTMAVNLRAPRHADKDFEAVQADIQTALEAWKGSSGSPAEIEVSLRNWMYRDPEGAWLSLLLEIFGETTGLPSEPTSTAGSTTAKLLPNAVNFGPNMPGDKYLGHTRGEFKRLDAFQFDLQMFTEMMARMSNLDSLE
ncbi:dipeptidase [Paracoccus marinaquae]|uniref:Dipeptidase n=1 Tax=Paracoccus marinaquae TaxID=2841926 RepID=A0ABS6AL10_9RHOB|nr:dipeptidase [Paracoccus marinaquae]MBU3030340.1 dipeptidase [Paracoccus marinaquae]